MLYFRDYGYKPADEIEWAWSATFWRPTVKVKFEDGYICWTYPQDSNHDPKELRKLYGEWGKR